MTNLLYQRTAALLRTEINHGSHEGGTLPTEAQLCERFGVSRSTIRKALQLLRREGLVISRQGSGWSLPSSVPAMRLGVRDASDITGRRAQLTVIGSRTAPAGDVVATALRSEPGAELLMVERASLVDDTMVHRSETWFARNVGADLDPDQAQAEPPALLLSQLGYTIADIDQYAEAVISDTRDEELMGVPPDSPILQVSRLVFDADHVPLFLSLHRHPGSSTRIALNLPTTDNLGGSVVSLAATTERPDPHS